MPLITGYMNVYKSGYFHRQNKPGALDRHAGDFYPTVDAAKADIEPASHYVATVGPFEWWEDEAIQPNPPTAKPIPLSLTRRPKVA